MRDTTSGRYQIVLTRQFGNEDNSPRARAVHGTGSGFRLLIGGCRLDRGQYGILAELRLKKQQLDRRGMYVAVLWFFYQCKKCIALSCA